MKPITFLGDSLARLRELPDAVRSEAGYQLSEVQLGNDPADWKPMKTVGPGVREIRVRDVASAHIDGADAEDDVRAAVNVVLEADLGSEDAQFVVDQAEGHELAWYATQELGAALELL